MSTLLKGKVAVITGGAGVLGTAMTKALAEAGASVAILGRDLAKAQALATEINRSGGIAIGISADVLNKSSLESARAEISEKLGKCDILVNGAGGNHPKGTTSAEMISKENLLNPEVTTFFDLDPEGAGFVFNLNFLGTLIPTQVFAQDMMNRPDCSIINISSLSAQTALTKVPAYSAAKAAVSNFTQWLAVHFAEMGVRVNAIAPGFFLTEQNRTLLTTETGGLTPRGEKIIRRTPMARFGKPEELNSTLLWLCDPASRFVSGIVVPVDGGYSAYSGV